MAQIEPALRYEKILREWFPAPEFAIRTTYKMEHLALMLSVVHRKAGMCVDQMVDEEIALELDAREHFALPMAMAMHRELCRVGECLTVDPVHVPIANREFPEITALCNLVGLKLRFRNVRGDIGRSGRAIYIVRPSLWAREINPETLEQPLEWWQRYVTSLVTGD